MGAITLQLKDSEGDNNMATKVKLATDFHKRVAWTKYIYN